MNQSGCEQVGAARSAERRGFSLLELLVVIAVVVSLAAMTLGILSIAKRKEAVARAEHQLSLLALQVEAYSGERGGTPVQTDLDGLIVYTMLYGDGVGEDHEAGTGDDSDLDCRPDPGARIYLAELDPHANSLGLVSMAPGSTHPERLVDPFGNPWRYRSGRDVNAVNPDFDLWSAGPDGVSGTSDDIANW